MKIKNTLTLAVLTLSLAFQTVSITTLHAKDKKEEANYNFDVVTYDQVKKAKKGSARVNVTVSGIVLTDPDQVKEKNGPNQGHLHYQLDTNTIIATTATSLSFHNLATGTHNITVRLVGNDHKPLGPVKAVEVVIP